MKHITVPINERARYSVLLAQDRNPASPKVLAENVAHWQAAARERRQHEAMRKFGFNPVIDIRTGVV